MFILTIAATAYAIGTASACYGAAHALDLTRETLTQDGTRILTIVAGVAIHPCKTPPTGLRRLSHDGLTLDDGSRLPAIHDVIAPGQAA